MASTLKVQNIAHTGGTTAANVESDGSIKYPQQPRFSAVASNSANSGAFWDTKGTPANNHAPIPFDIEIVDNNDYIDILIIDNGKGITDAKKAMTPYFTTKKTGTGLGLPIVTKIINEHSGNFSIKNK